MPRRTGLLRSGETPVDSPGQEALQKRLERAEQALERSEGFAVASRFASVIMHEVNNPLESITNLVYLTKLQRDDPDQVLENMHVIITNEASVTPPMCGVEMTFGSVSIGSFVGTGSCQIRPNLHMQDARWRVESRAPHHR